MAFAKLAQDVLPRKTGWTIEAQAGGGVTVQTPVKVIGGGAGTVRLWVKNGPDGAEQLLTVTGVRGSVGGGFSSPVNVDASIREFPSSGIGNIYAGPTHSGALGIRDLEGLTFIYTPNYAFSGASSSVSMVFFGLPYAMLATICLPGMLAYSNAGFYATRAIGFCASLGAELTAAGASFGVFAGHAAAA